VLEEPPPSLLSLPCFLLSPAANASPSSRSPSRTASASPRGVSGRSATPVSQCASHRPCRSRSPSKEPRGVIGSAPDGGGGQALASGFPTVALVPIHSVDEDQASSPCHASNCSPIATVVCSLLFAQDLAERRGNLPGIWRGCRDLVEKRPGERSQVVIKELLLEPPRRARASAPRQRTRHNDHQPVRRSCACPRTTPQPRGLPSEGAVTRALALAFAESAERGDLGELSSRIRAAQVSVVDPYRGPLLTASDVMTIKVHRWGDQH
jgi:hypothetical protein